VRDLLVDNHQLLGLRYGLFSGPVHGHHELVGILTAPHHAHHLGDLIKRRRQRDLDLGVLEKSARYLKFRDGGSDSLVARSDIYGEIEEFAILIQNTSKPLEYLCENVESFTTAIDMAVAVRGSRQALEEKPYFMQLVTPLPLTYWRTHIDQIIIGARRGIPLSIGTLPPEVLTALNDTQARFKGNDPPRATGLEQPCRS
jgi:hypothetical protein